MTGTPRERRRRRTRQVILDAALQLTESEGFSAWTMRDLADRIEYTPGAAYRYFDSKEALLAALNDATLEALGDHLRRAADHNAEPPIDRVQAIALGYLDFARDNEARFRLAFVDAASRRTGLDQPVTEESPYHVLIGAVEQAIEHGDLAATPSFGSEQIAFTIWATVHGMALLELTHLRPLQEEIQRAAPEAVHRLLTGLSRS